MSDESGRVRTRFIDIERLAECGTLLKQSSAVHSPILFSDEYRDSLSAAHRAWSSHIAAYSEVAKSLTVAQQAWTSQLTMHSEVAKSLTAMTASAEWKSQMTAVADLAKNLATALSTASDMSSFGKQIQRMNDMDLSIGRQLSAVANRFADFGTVGDSIRRAATAVDLTGFDRVGKSLRESLDASTLNFASSDFRQLFEGIETARSAVTLVATTQHFADAHATFLASATSESVPDGLLVLPSTGLVAHSSTLRALTSDDIEFDLDSTDDETFILEHLGTVSRTLLQNYLGMKQAARNRNADWWSQAGSSGRKLVIGVLNLIAPDPVVVPWSKSNRFKLHTDRQATRDAKVTWLCSHVSNQKYRLAVQAQLLAGLSVMKYLNKTQHADPDANLIRAFPSVVREIEQLVRHLITIWLIRLG